MIPVTRWEDIEAMYRGLGELMMHKEFVPFDNGQWRIVEIPVRKFPPINKQAVFVILEHSDMDEIDWPEWIAMAEDGEHPDGYASFEEALKALLSKHGPVLCPLCPDWDTRYPIGPDFFGEGCWINGVPCCETCYRVHHLTSDEDEQAQDDNPQQTWNA